MSPTERMLVWLLTYFGHSTVLLAVAAVITRRSIRSPAIRESIWKGALLAGLVTSSLQAVGVSSLTTGYTFQTNRTTPRTAAAPLPAHSPAATALPIVETPSPSLPMIDRTEPTRALPSPTIVVVAGWALVAIVMLVGFAVRRWQLARRLGPRSVLAGHPAVEELSSLIREAGHRRPVVLTVSTRLSSPIAVGLSEVCVPAIALRDLDDRERRSMLAHELAHLIRFDTVWLTVAALLERVFFFQPLNRVARRAIQADAELLCDEWAAARMGSGLTMAKCLVKVAEWIDAAPRPIPVAGMAEERSQLVDRVQRLVKEGPMSIKPRRRMVVAGVMAVVVGMALIAPKVALVGQDPTPKTTPAPAVAGSPRTPVAAVGRGPAAALAPRMGGPVTPRPAMAWGVSRAPVAVLSGRDRGSLQDSSGTVVAALAATLKDGDPGVRQAAAQSLGAIGDRRATAALVAALADEEPVVRLAVVEALGRLADPKSIDALAERLKDPSRDVRRAAIESLGQFEHGLSAAPFRPLLEDQDVEVQSAAARILAALKDRSSSPVLVRLLANQNADVRRTAIEALGELGDRSALDAIIAAIRDPNQDVREAALNAISQFELEAAPPAVLEALSDKNADVRRSAAALVGSLGDRRAVSALRGLLTDPKADVREAAVGALGSIRDQAAIDALVAGLKSNDPVVRKAAAEALGQRQE